MFEEGINFSVFYCLLFVSEISTDIFKEQLREEGYPFLELEEDIVFLDDRDKQRKKVIVENN